MTRTLLVEGLQVVRQLWSQPKQAHLALVQIQVDQPEYQQASAEFMVINLLDLKDYR
jgi:hypothetical protein